MLQSPNLSLQYIDLNEAQREVVHNNAIRGLDALVQLAVLDRDLAAPPGSPADGQRWIVAASPTGAWAGHAKHIAAWQDGAWRFYVPSVGWLVYLIDEGCLLAWSGSAWIDAMAVLTTLQNMVMLGIGTTADSTNPLSAKLNNTLWTAKTVAEGGNGDLRYKLSKESAAKTLSLLMQTNFSGRAEIGLAGDDDLHFKVSADGSAWTEGLVLSRTSGAATFAAPLCAPAGTVSAPAYAFAADSDSGLYRIGANNIGVALNGAKVGDWSTTGLTVTGSLTASSAVLATSGGNVGIGTTTTDFAGYGQTTLTIRGVSNFANLELANNVADSAAALAGFVNYIIPSNNSTYRNIAYIGAWTDSSGTANKRGGNIRFATQPDNTAGPIERMRIDSDGRFLIGYTSSAGAYPLQVNGQIFATNATIATSDLDLKSVLPDGLSNSLLDAVAAIPTLLYTRKDLPDAKLRAGYGAQHWQSALRTQGFDDSGIVASLNNGKLALDEGAAHSLKIASLERRISILETRSLTEPFNP